MDNIKDEDRKCRLRKLEDIIRSSQSVGNIDSLLDTVQALNSDCDHPAIKKLKNVEVYTNRCKLVIVAIQTFLSNFHIIFS